VGAGNKVEIRPVVATDRVGSDWVIEKGIKPGERVIVEGLIKARPGDLVDVEVRNPASALASATSPAGGH
jgi:membrane fusion protein (multidrug efflux system)